VYWVPASAGMTEVGGAQKNRLIMKFQKLQPVKGTKDILLEEGELFSYVTNIARNAAKLYGYSEAQIPIFEFTEVFKRTLGETSDVVNKEMYTFEDKGERSITLRPEFTAGLVRAVISNSLYDRLPLRLFSSGPVFRYENPQKGRYRQFNQFNCEHMGGRSPMIDAEMIVLAKEILDKLELTNISLEVNSLGDPGSRKNYSEALVAYLTKYKGDLSPDSQVRLTKNPLRILDSKSSADQKILEGAPILEDFLTKDSFEFFEGVMKHLDSLDIKYTINNRIVRGLDYYTDTVFEFITTELGSQGTVIAGGRYDGLFELMGGRAVPAIGFAGGIERLMALYKGVVLSSNLVTVIVLNSKFVINGLELVQKIRKENVNAIVEESKDIGKSIKKALDNKSKFIIFLGENEVSQGKFKLKNLDTREEKLLSESELMMELK
jgi:histidyl-tRNA synthetase